jgi:hypothetical protein
VNLIGRSLFIFSPTNVIRRLLSKLIVHNLFEMFIFAVVIFSAILMVFDDPLADAEQEIFKIFDNINLGISAIFFTELIMKIVVYGFIFNGTDSFLRNGWNILDFVIVLTSVLSIVVEIFGNQASNTPKFLELLKMLRILRSLRIISRNEGLQLSVLSLVYSLPGILNVTIVTLLFLLLFGIFFQNMLKGKFYNCKFHPSLEELVNLE